LVFVVVVVVVVFDGGGGGALSPSLSLRYKTGSILNSKGDSE